MQDENSLQLKGFLVWGVCAAFFLYEFFLRTVIGTYQHPLMQELELNFLQFSLLSSTVFILIYGVMQVPAGILLDHFGLKKSLLFACLVCAAASLGFAYSYSYPIAIAFRFLMGLGASFGFIGLLIAVNDWMPHRHLGAFIGLSQFIGTLGPMMAAGPLDSLANTHGVDWRFIFSVLAVIGLVLAVLVFAFVENNTRKAGKYTVLRKPEPATRSIRKLFSRSQPWVVAFSCACLYFTIEYLSENEGRIFLSFRGLDFNRASYAITVAWIGYAIACPLLGWISDRVERRKSLMIACALLGLLAIICILHGEAETVILASFFLLGVSAAGQSIGFAMVPEHFKASFVAVGFGLTNGTITVISAVNAPAIGWLLDYLRDGPEVTLANYLFVFNILVATAVLGIVLCVFFLRETYCKSAVDFTFLNPKATA